MKNIFSIPLILCFTLLSQGKLAPEGMKEFNKLCPAERLCPILENKYQECKSTGEESKCIEFVRTMQKLNPLYDCQRSIDSTETADYIVPALWICSRIRSENNEPRTGQYLELLSKLRIPEARNFFASKEFRRVLDGYWAERYLEASEKLERELKRNHAQ